MCSAANTPHPRFLVITSGAHVLTGATEANGANRVGVPLLSANSGGRLFFETRRRRVQCVGGASRVKHREFVQRHVVHP